MPRMADLQPLEVLNNVGQRWCNDPGHECVGLDQRRLSNDPIRGNLSLYVATPQSLESRDGLDPEA